MLVGKRVDGFDESTKYCVALSNDDGHTEKGSSQLDPQLVLIEGKYLQLEPHAQHLFSDVLASSSALDEKMKKYPHELPPLARKKARQVLKGQISESVLEMVSEGGDIL